MAHYSFSAKCTLRLFSASIFHFIFILFSFFIYQHFIIHFPSSLEEPEYFYLCSHHKPSAAAAQHRHTNPSAPSSSMTKFTPKGAKAQSQIHLSVVSDETRKYFSPFVRGK